jgi:hypothetical protein
MYRLFNAKRASTAAFKEHTRAFDDAGGWDTAGSTVAMRTHLKASRRRQLSTFGRAPTRSTAQA